MQAANGSKILKYKNTHFEYKIVSNYKWDSVKISVKMFILETDFLVNSDLPVNMYAHTLSDNMTDLSNRNGK